MMYDESKDQLFILLYVMIDYMNDDNIPQELLYNNYLIVLHY